MRGNRQGWTIAIGTVVLVLVLSLGTTGVFAGDGSDTIGTDPEEVEASAGETVEIAIVINSLPDSLGYGLEAYEYTVDVDETNLSISDIEHGSYLGQNGDEVETSLDEGSGSATIRHEIDPNDRGVNGTGVTATVTIAVDEDAPPSYQEIGFSDASVRTTADNQGVLFTRNGTIIVDGGGDDPDDESGDDGVSVTTPDNEAADDDSLPGFGPLAGIGAVLIGAWSLVQVRDHQ